MRLSKKKDCIVQLLSIIFCVPIFAIAVAAALHATDYLHGEATHHRPRFWFFFVATIFAMAFVVFSSTPLLFLLAWEAMGLMSAGLVAFENTEKSVRRATWIYLLACHAGACALMLSAVLLSSPSSFLAAFVLAVVGFGLKIGFPPFHVWLPEAHPAAPAPASAVMSGAMIPLGFYGLLRFFYPMCAVVPHQNFAGWLLLALGVIGTLGGILFACPQTNLKRLLAFSSVENMGILAMGFGLAILANLTVSNNSSTVISSFACAGALAHIINHAFLKGSLFLGAGSILRQTGTLDLDAMGGLLKRMPKTGTLMTLNALGLAGLPPLNGFLGELLIYFAGFYAIRYGQPHLLAAGFLVILTLALSGGLAVATYCKVIGAAFLGEPRSPAAAHAVETPCRMYLAQLFLFVLSLAMIPGTIFLAHHETGGRATPFLITAAGAGFAIVGLTLALLFVRRVLSPRGKIKPSVPTWDCGYHAPTPRMAYTGTAFTQPIADFMRAILHPRRHVIPFTGHPATPQDAALATETDDRVLVQMWRPIFTFFARIFQRVHLLQNGSLHLYILIILLSVILLLIAAFAL